MAKTKREELKELKEHSEKLAKHIIDCKRESEETILKIKAIEKELFREISDDEALRAGHTWQRFEKEMCDDKLRDLTYDLAKTTGRSTLAIRYKLLNLLVKELPAETVIEKVTIMVKR